MIKLNTLSTTLSGTRIPKNGKCPISHTNKKIWDFLKSVLILVLVSTARIAQNLKKKNKSISRILTKLKISHHRLLLSR